MKERSKMYLRGARQCVDEALRVLDAALVAGDYVDGTHAIALAEVAAKQLREAVEHVETSIAKERAQ